MSIETHPASIQPDAVAPAPPTSGPVARVFAGSVAAGIAAALVLILVVFAGGSESVITGAVLVSFGFGWALMAALTGRHTDRPQSWAYVPAAAMGVTGLALLVFTPENDVLTRQNLASLPREPEPPRINNLCGPYPRCGGENDSTPQRQVPRIVLYIEPRLRLG